MNVNNTAFMFLIVLSLILTITIGHETLAIKLTATSYSDGIKQGINDALCDINQCHGHGYDPSCPSGLQTVSWRLIVYSMDRMKQ
jgi:hypothetical protein